MLRASRRPAVPEAPAAAAPGAPQNRERCRRRRRLQRRWHPPEELQGNAGGQEPPASHASPPPHFGLALYCEPYTRTAAGLAPPPHRSADRLSETESTVAPTPAAAALTATTTNPDARARGSIARLSWQASTRSRPTNRHHHVFGGGRHLAAAWTTSNDAPNGCADAATSVSGVEALTRTTSPDARCGRVEEGTATSAIQAPTSDATAAASVSAGERDRRRRACCSTGGAPAAHQRPVRPESTVLASAKVATVGASPTAAAEQPAAMTPAPRHARNSGHRRDRCIERRGARDEADADAPGRALTYGESGPTRRQPRWTRRTSGRRRPKRPPPPRAQRRCVRHRPGGPPHGGRGGRQARGGRSH